MAKRGRPSKYKPEYAEQAYKLCLLGATDKELSEFFNVNEDTIHEWSKKNNEFSVSKKRAKLLADANVAERLYQRATGYDCIEDKVFFDEGAPKKFKVQKHIVPDVAAICFWLKNRARDKWKDRHDVSWKNELTKHLDGLSDEELEKLATLIIQQQKQ
jgi:hypothetical protein